jgi:hypothetical protein
VKKLFVLVPTFVLAVALAVNVYAQDTIHIPIVSSIQESVRAAAAYIWPMATGDTAHVECADNHLAIMGQTETSIDLHCMHMHDTTLYHAPTDHEHGVAAPDWADAFSQQWFGHPVMYGGDENSGPMENTMKHQGYKGIVTPYEAGGIVSFLRVHIMSNPMDRCTQYHSYEAYAKDAAGNISFWQGWIDTGDPATTRFVRPAEDRPNRPILLVIDETSWYRTADHEPIRSEQWYMRTADWSWNLGWNIEPTTMFRANECDNPMDMSTWVLAPNLNKGLVRVSDSGWIGPDGTSTGIARGNPPIDTWFCATPIGEITNRAVSHPSECAAGTLPQYIANTMRTVPAKNAVKQDLREFSSQILLPN